MAGLRVVRGADWKWENQDGSEGQVGTATGKKARGGWIHILWDLGRKNEFRAGAEDCCDLLVLDNGPAGVYHTGVTCDACKENNIRGLRWKCADCPDYDLCTECYGNDKHDRNHKFKRRDIPRGPMHNVGRRQHAIKLQSRGLYNGATVVRGEDWDKGSQDGGSGGVGKVTKVGYVREAGQMKAGLVVQWSHDPGSAHVYRRGLGGKVDVKCTITAIGWPYYRDHLPQLRNENEFVDPTLARQTSAEEHEPGDMLARLLAASMMGRGLGGDLAALQLLQENAKAKRAATMREFSVGDSVRLHDDLETVQKLQDGHGDFNIFMIPVLGQTGIVTEIDCDGDIKVRFGGNVWTLNPRAVTKLPKISQPRPSPPKADSNSAVRTRVTAPAPTAKVKIQNEVAPSKGFQAGDKVRIDHDIDFVKRAQNRHGGWHDDMKKDAKIIGTVKEIDGDGDVKVEFEGRSWTLNPEVLHKVKVETGTTGKKNKNVNKNINETLVIKESTFEPGDRITLDNRVDFLKNKQDGHGGWSDDMLKVLYEVGTVESVDEDGDLKVKFGDTSWVLNPEVCRKDADVRPKKKDVNVHTETGEYHFKIGDKVKMIQDAERVKNLQVGHGGWNDAMRNVDIMVSYAVVGRVTAVDDDGDVTVDFVESYWTLNPAALVKHEVSKTKDVNATKYANILRKKESRTQSTKSSSSKYKSGAFAEGDQIKINVSIEQLKEIQKGHGGWSQGMLKAVGQIGLLETIDPDGDLHVDFPNGKFILSPEACVSLNPEKHKPSQADEGPKNTTFTPGDCVRFASDTERVMSLQQGHGGWNGAMNLAVGKVGVVSELLPGGDIKVKFGDNCWPFNPAVFKPVNEGEGSKPLIAPKPRVAFPSSNRESTAKYRCSICLDKGICVVFNCGHGTCDVCSKSIDNCHICRNPIALRTKMFL